MSIDRPGDSADPAPRSLLWAGQVTASNDAGGRPTERGRRADEPARPVLGPDAFWRREFILTGPPPSKKYRQRER